MHESLAYRMWGDQLWSMLQAMMGVFHDCGNLHDDYIRGHINRSTEAWIARIAWNRKAIYQNSALWTELATVFKSHTCTGIFKVYIIPICCILPHLVILPGYTRCLDACHIMQFDSRDRFIKPWLAKLISKRTKKLYNADLEACMTHHSRTSAKYEKQIITIYTVLLVHKIGRHAIPSLTRGI